MRLDSVLDSFYLLGSLWSVIPGTGVCPSVGYSPSRTPASGIPAEVTAFIEVNVVPMDTERVLADQTVVVEGGRITALGPSGKVQVPAGAVRIDGRGKYLMPGLADMHAHLFFTDPGDEGLHRLVSYLAYGITTVRQVDPARLPYQQHSLTKQRLEWSRFKSAEFLGPRLYLAGPLWEIGPRREPPKFRPLEIPKPPDLKWMKLDSVAAYIAAYKAQGYDFLALPDRSQEEHASAAFDSMLVAARRVGLPVSAHDHGAPIETVLKLGTYGGSHEHLYAFNDLLKRPAAEVSTAEVQARVTAIQRAGTWITVTLGCTEYNPRGHYHSSSLELAHRIIKALQDAGAGLLLGSDAGGGVGLSPSIVHTELASLVRAGLSPYQALLTGTRNIAQYFGILDSSGTVAVGKRADLVLLYGNPLLDIRHAQEPAGVMISGRWLDRTALDQLLLDSPKSWFQVEIQRSIMGKGMISSQKFNRLADSLERATPSEYERLLRLLTDELGAIRTSLTPEQRKAFDPKARVWMRQHARQGYRVVIPGVAPTP